MSTKRQAAGTSTAVASYSLVTCHDRDGLKGFCGGGGVYEFFFPLGVYRPLKKGPGEAGARA